MTRNRVGVAILSCGLAATLSMSATARSNLAMIEIIGGQLAGKYTLEADDVGCELSEHSAKKTFSMNFGKDTHVATELSFITVDIRNVGSQPLAQSDYLAAVTFGEVTGTHNTFYMSGSNKTTGKAGGPGKVTLNDAGKAIEVVLDLQPAPGITIKGSVSCTKVLRY